MITTNNLKKRLLKKYRKKPQLKEKQREKQQPQKAKEKQLKNLLLIQNQELQQLPQRKEKIQMQMTFYLNKNMKLLLKKIVVEYFIRPYTSKMKIVL